MITKKKVLTVLSINDARLNLKDLFPISQYDSSKTVSSIAQAKRLLAAEEFDLVLIVAPIKDEMGIRSSKEISVLFHVPVLLFVKPDIYDMALYQVKDAMVFVLTLPVFKSVAVQTIGVMEKVNHQLQEMDRKIKKERQKLRDEKIINRCKLMLIENYRWSEERAHHYIEKMAMDHSITKVIVSKTLLNKMEQQKG